MDLERIDTGERTWEDTLPVLKDRLRFIINQSLDAGYMVEAIRELSVSSAAPFVPVDIRLVLETALAVEKSLIEKHAAVLDLRLPADSGLIPGPESRIRTRICPPNGLLFQGAEMGSVVGGGD